MHKEKQVRNVAAAGFDPATFRDVHRSSEILRQGDNTK